MFETEGGVFIATLVGLALAMITLAGEVMYYKKRNKTQDFKQKEVGDLQIREKDLRQFSKQQLPKKLPFKAAPIVAFVEKPPGPRPRASHISVYPRPFPFKE